MLHEGDLVLSESASRLQKDAYGADYTHVSIYAGPALDGSPMFSEDVLRPFGQFPNVTGEVLTRPLEQSDAYASRVTASIYSLPGLDEKHRYGVAHFAVLQTGKPYHIESFELMADMGRLFDKARGSPSLTRRLEGQAAKLRKVLNSRKDYICTTLVRTAYLEGAGVDVAARTGRPWRRGVGWRGISGGSSGTT
jgi:hypothetical protein